MAIEPDKRDEGLKDPYESLIEDMRTNPSDAAALAQFVDASIIVEELKKIEYDVRRKIQVLGVILKDGSNAEKMRAMRELDTIRESSLAHRGIMVRPTPQLPQASAMPVGLPQAVDAVTLSETRRRTVTMRKQYDCLTEQPPSQQPLKEPDHAEKSKERNPGDDSYFEDDRAENPDIFRPATGANGEGNLNNGW